MRTVEMFVSKIILSHMSQTNVKSWEFLDEQLIGLTFGFKRILNKFYQ